ncbi:MAG: hypothetical protein JRJ87_21735 [Deltaproteobacteria bacterium]|nr:hypothetical protein [Deltaproteobacteria bacterium]
MTRPRMFCHVLLCAAIAFGFSGCGGATEEPDGSTNDAGDGGLDDCQQDNSTKGSTDDEWKLTAGGEALSGYICPKRDIDHYWFTVDTARTIVAVSLSNNVALSEVDLCYDIFLQGQDIRISGKCDSDGTDGITELEGTHYLEEAGTYFIEVRDEGGDDEDPRLPNNYMLSIELVPDKDGYEPNNTVATAADPGVGQGYISYLGDQDWFKLTVNSSGQVLTLDLTNTDMTPVDLRYEVFMPDQTTPINGGQDDDGMRNTTALHDILALGEAGTYYILITDVMHDDSDLDVGYTLTVSTQNNPDPRDRTGSNDTWDTATPITSGSTVSDGYIATRGDDDWYVITSPGTTDANPALIEIDIVVPSTSVIDPAIDLHVADPNTACSAGDACDQLVWSCGGCDNIIDCINAQCPSHECLTFAGKCKGNGMCMNGGSYTGCGILSLFMHGPDWSESGSSKHLHTVAPMYGEKYYVKVNDYQARHVDTAHAYNLTVTVHPELDTHDSPPNGLYLPYITGVMEDETRDWNRGMATTISCSQTATEITCGPIEGYLSYRGDQDWYKLDIVIPQEAESDPATMGDNIDYDLLWDWSFSGRSDMPLGYVVMAGSREMGPELGVGSGTWGDGGGECSYLCGEYQLPTTLYLWVFTPTFKKYDYQNPYNLTIRAVKGVCPDNCSYCEAGQCNYPCPNPNNPVPDCD